MHKSRSLLFLLLSCLGCGAVDDAPADDESSIQGGHTDADDPAVGLVWLQGGGFCSGVLITPSVVLTAGHCVSAGPIEAFFTGAGKATTAIGPEPAGGVVRHFVAAQLPHPSYSPYGGCPNQTFDVGLVRLASPIKSIRPLLRTTRAPSTSRLCRVVGYGVHNSDATHATIEQKRAGSVYVQSVGDTWISVLANTAISDHGDSGGPLLCDNHVAGVTSCGTDGSYPNHKLTFYARTDDIGEWIDSVIAGWK
jgi:hypothetical protein